MPRVSKSLLKEEEEKKKKVPMEDKLTGSFKAAKDTIEEIDSGSPMTPSDLEKASVKNIPKRKKIANNETPLTKEIKKENIISKVEEESVKELSEEIDLQPDTVKKNKPQRPVSQFQEALSFFAPALIGGAIGAAFEGGAGALAGIQQGQSLSQAFRDEQFRRDKLEAASAPDSLAQQRLAISKGNLEIRKAEIKEQKKRTANLEEDRTLRRQERDLNRSIQAKEDFAKRGDVKKYQETRILLDDIENIINDAPEIAAGTIGFKIAKGIAGEVGNLTEAERNDAQISPSFYRKVNRLGTKFFTGRIPEEDREELQKVVEAIRAKKLSKFRSTVKGFTKSRAKSFEPDIANDFESDLINEYGLEVKKAAPKGVKKSSIRMSYETAIQQAKSIEEIEKIKSQFGVK